MAIKSFLIRFAVALGAIWLLLACAFSDQSVTLAWDPNPEPDVAGYLVYYGNASRNYPYHTNVGNVTTATVYGLQEGLTYFFAITATNTSGLESDFSNEVTNAVPQDITNTVPTIAPVEDQSWWTGQAILLVETTVGDVETPVDKLALSVSSTNTTFLPMSNIVFQAIGAVRRIYLAPKGEGITLVILTISDGAKASSTSFLLSVSPFPVPQQTRIVTGLQESDSLTGPWNEVYTTSIPLRHSSTKFYRMVFAWTNTPAPIVTNTP